MAGSYCRFCGFRCFVVRVVPGTPYTHLATCPDGMAFDREHLDGRDSSNTLNPITGKIGNED